MSVDRDDTEILLRVLPAIHRALDRMDQIVANQLAVVEELKGLVAMNVDLLQAYDAALLKRAFVSEFDLRDTRELTAALKELSRLRGPLNNIVSTLREVELERRVQFVAARQAGVPEERLRS